MIRFWCSFLLKNLKNMSLCIRQIKYIFHLYLNMVHIAFVWLLFSYYFMKFDNDAFTKKKKNINICRCLTYLRVFFSAWSHAAWLCAFKISNVCFKNYLQRRRTKKTKLKGDAENERRTTKYIYVYLIHMMHFAVSFFF